MFTSPPWLFMHDNWCTPELSKRHQIPLSPLGVHADCLVFFQCQCVLRLKDLACFSKDWHAHLRRIALRCWNSTQDSAILKGHPTFFKPNGHFVIFGFRVPRLNVSVWILFGGPQHNKTFLYVLIIFSHCFFSLHNRPIFKPRWQPQKNRIQKHFWG